MSDVIAIGGGGFMAQPPNFALEKYLLDQARSPRPRVLMIPTARGDDAAYIARFHEAFGSLGAETRALTFFERTPDVRSLILSHDVVYVGGGNTKSMLAVWREWGVPDVLKEAFDAGIVLGGQSAGAICWFEQGVTDSWADRLRALDCLGMLSGSCCPHYDGEPERRPAYHALLREGAIAPGYAIDDGAAVHFKDARLHQVVSKRPGAAAYRVAATDGRVEESPIRPIFLPAVS